MLRKLLVVTLFICVSESYSGNHYRQIDQLKSKVTKGYSVYKEIQNAKGMIVIFDGYREIEQDYDEAASDLFAWTKIPKLASRRGWVSIVVPYGKNIWMDSELYEIFQIVIMDALKRFSVQENRYIIGGFSAGGAMATGFTAAVVRDNLEHLFPKAVFAVDPVLDISEWYKGMEREKERNCQAPNAHIGIDEAKILTKFCDSKLGNPYDSVQNYVRYSPYSMSQKDGGNVQYLRSVPVRLYHELDPMWSIKERCRTLMDENGIVGCTMIHTLYMAGNKNAEVILSHNRGHRIDGTRHPHSWNIVEEKDFIQWAKRILK